MRAQLSTIRTATMVARWVALAGLGFVVARFHLLVEATPPTSGWHQARVLGVALVVGLVVALLGLRQHRQVSQMLAAHGDDLPLSQKTTVAASVVITPGPPSADRLVRSCRAART